MAILVIDGVLVHGGALLTRLGPTICLLVVMLVLPLAAGDHFLPPYPFLCTFAWGPHSGSEQLGAWLSLFVQPGLRACCAGRVWQAFFLEPHFKGYGLPCRVGDMAFAICFQSPGVAHHGYLRMASHWTSLRTESAFGLMVTCTGGCRASLLSSRPSLSVVQALALRWQLCGLFQ